MNDLVLLVAAVGLFLGVIAVSGAILDWLDPYGEREDARRRNGR